jgi:hypothetical protein
MTTSTAIPAAIQIRRSRLLGLLAAVAILTAAITWALSAFALADSSSSTGQTSVLTGTLISTTSAAQDAARAPSIMALTPSGLAARALGTGYALPTAHHGPTLASVLTSMRPETRRYTRAVMSLTFAQLAAGAASHP